MTRPASLGRRAFLATALLAPVAGATLSRPQQRLTIGLLGEGPLAAACDCIASIHTAPPRFTVLAGIHPLPAGLDGLVITESDPSLLRHALEIGLPVCMPLPDCNAIDWEKVCVKTRRAPVQLVSGAGSGDWSEALNVCRTRLAGSIRYVHHGYASQVSPADWMARHMALTVLAGMHQPLRASAFPGTPSPVFTTLACDSGCTMTLGVSPTGIAPRTVIRSETGFVAWESLPQPSPGWLLAEWLDALQSGNECTMGLARVRAAAAALQMAHTATRPFPAFASVEGHSAFAC